MDANRRLTRWKSWRPWIIGLAAFAALVVVAGAGVALWFTILAPALHKPAATPQTYECVWSGTAQTWLDENKNGQLDPGERPLGQVPVALDDTANGMAKVATAVSDETGTARLSVFIPGCVPVKLEVYAAAPAGYCATTPARVSAIGQGPFRFGFVKCQ